MSGPTTHQKPTLFQDVLNSISSPNFYRTIVPRYTTLHTVLYIFKLCVFASLIRSAIFCITEIPYSKLNTDWDTVRGLADTLWPENLEIDIPIVGIDQHREIKINHELPHVIYIPILEPENPSKVNTPDSNTTTTEVSETEPETEIPLVVFEQFGKDLTDLEMKELCDSWGAPLIIGTRGFLLCASEAVNEKFSYIDLDKFSAFLPEKINRSFWLAIVDTVETIVNYNLPVIIAAGMFLLLWMGFFVMYFVWWIWSAFFYGLTTFVIISVIHLVYPRFPYTFGEILQLCSYNLTFQFLYSFLLLDSLGYLISLIFLLFSISVNNRTPQ